MLITCRAFIMLQGYVQALDVNYQVNFPTNQWGAGTIIIISLYRYGSRGSQTLDNWPKSHTCWTEEQGFKTKPVWLQKLMLFTSKLSLQSFPCIFHSVGAESFDLLVFWVISVNRARSDVSSALCLVSSLFPSFFSLCSPPTPSSLFLLPWKKSLLRACFSDAGEVW